MPLPLLFIGVAAATGGLGIGKTIKAGVDANSAKHLNQDANYIVETATNRINLERKVCGDALSALGREKVSILNGSITKFLDSFVQIKNVDFEGSEGLEELKKFHPSREIDG